MWLWLDELEFVDTQGPRTGPTATGSGSEPRSGIATCARTTVLVHERLVAPWRWHRAAWARARHPVDLLAEDVDRILTRSDQQDPPHPHPVGSMSRGEPDTRGSDSSGNSTPNLPRTRKQQRGAYRTPTRTCSLLT
jgi:hypothetical protein